MDKVCGIRINTECIYSKAIHRFLCIQEHMTDSYEQIMVYFVIKELWKHNVTVW